MKKVILTGDRPTGRLHVGHYVGSLSERVKLQNADPFLTNTVVLIYNHFSKHSPFFYMNMQNVQST